MGYKPASQRMERFIKMEVTHPILIRHLRQLFEDGYSFSGVSFEKKTYESNMPYCIKMMTIKDLRASGWVWVKNYQVVGAEEERVSTCQLELNVDYEDISSAPDRTGEGNLIGN